LKDGGGFDGGEGDGDGVFGHAVDDAWGFAFGAEEASEAGAAGGAELSGDRFFLFGVKLFGHCGDPLNGAPTLNGRAAEHRRCGVYHGGPEANQAS